MALELIKSGRIRIKELITHRFGLLNAAEAFETALENKESLKAMVLSE